MMYWPSLTRLGILEKGGYRKRDNDNIFGNLTAELGITKDLKIKVCLVVPCYQTTCLAGLYK
jgi:hypothetical protein